MKNTYNYHIMVTKMRQFFQSKGFIEVPAQSRVSILAACEDPFTITNYQLGGVKYPLPQTGQMWLEYELLTNPTWPGAYTITTSYRDEPNPIEGRHLRIFPMFEFESHGGFDELRKLELELLEFLGFDEPVSIEYKPTAQRYETQTIESHHETALERELGSSILLEQFPHHTDPFWNMKYRGDGLYNKIDVILCGQETIGSAERETDVAFMRDRFFTIKDGKYCQKLFNDFGKERVMHELDAYFTLPMIQRFGGGIGITRLERAMTLCGLFDTEPSFVQPTSQQTNPSVFF